MATDELQSDPISAEWYMRVGAERSQVARPEVIAAARAVAGDVFLLRLVRRLSLEGRLKQYAKGDEFLRLVKKLVSDPRHRKGT